MEYISLTKIYYKTPDKVLEEYNNRFNAPTTRHIPINIKQYNRNNEYEAFFCYTENICLLIQKIYTNFKQLLHVKEEAPSILLRQFVLSSLIDEIKSTNDIEGVRSTKKQIRDILENETNTSDFMHLKSVVDKYSRIINNDEIQFNSCEDIRHFYDEFTLEEVISEHPDYIPDGKLFRKDIVEVKSATDKIVHQGVYPENKLIDYLTTALSLLNNNKIPSLIRIAIFHYLFAYIHPFYDGNGRTDRFISSYYLSEEFDEIVALRLAIIIKKHKNKYYKIFQDTDNEYNRGDLTLFVDNFLNMINLAIIEAIEILENKLKQLYTYRKKIKLLSIKDELTQEIYYILLQASLFYGEGVTIQQLMEITNKARGTVQQRLNNVPNAHIIINKNNKPFKYKLNMLIFRNKK